MLSGGVASNLYIRKALTSVAETTGLQLLCPPAKFCTDNGVMIAWCTFCILTFSLNWSRFIRHVSRTTSFFSPLLRNGVERLREQRGILPPNVDVRYEPKWVGSEFRIYWSKSKLNTAFYCFQGTSGCWYDSRGEGCSHQTAINQDEDQLRTVLLATSFK